VTGKYSTKKRQERPGLIDPSVARIQEMPDPDNLHIDLSQLPKTAPVTVLKRD